MSAMRFTGEQCVTAHSDSVEFELPVELGDIALIEARVYAAGRTNLRVDGEDPLTGESAATTESYFLFVAVDESRKMLDSKRRILSSIRIYENDPRPD